jgi:hypothetical protein
VEAIAAHEFQLLFVIDAPSGTSQSVGSWLYGLPKIPASQPSPHAL